MRHFLLSILAFIAILPLFSQQEQKPFMYWGLYGGYSANVHSADFVSLPNYPSCCMKFDNGFGNGYVFGIQTIFPLQDKFQLSFRFGVNNPSGVLLSTEKIGNQFIRNTNPPYDTIGRDILVDHTIDASLLYLSLMPSISYAPIYNFYLDAGLMVNYAVKGIFSQKEEISEPSNVTFLNGSGTRNEMSGDIPVLQTLQLGLQFGAHYDLPIASYSKLSPFIQYAYPLTNISSVQWNISQVQAGIALSFPVFPRKHITIIKDTIVERDTVYQELANISTETISKESQRILTKEGNIQGNIQRDTTVIQEHYVLYTPKPKAKESIASLALWGIDKDGTKQLNPQIKIEEWETAELFPILPHVYFPNGSHDLAATSQHLLMNNQTAQFNEDSLPSSTMLMYNEVLNITAKRLLKYGGTITISAHTNGLPEDADPRLPELRALSIKNYFVDTWHIPANSISVMHGNLPAKPSNNTNVFGQAENARVEWTASNPSILKPILKRTIEQTANPPSLAILPAYESDQKPAKWTLNIQQYSTIFDSITGIGDLPNEPLLWEIPHDGSILTERPLVVNLEVLDSQQKSSSIRRQVAIEQITIKKKREKLVGDKIIERFSLILFDFNSASLNPHNADILKTVQSSIKSNSTVIIKGHTDILGDSDYNKQLSLRRCQEVQKLLGLPDNRVILQPMGSENPPFDNSLPQGRAYSRTVQIEISTPR